MKKLHFILPILYVFMGMITLFVAVSTMTMIHDALHETGHGIVCRSYRGNVHISLGEYKCVTPTPSNPAWKVTAYPKYFYQTLYRTSETCCSVDDSIPASLLFAGGLFGLFGMYVITTSIAAISYSVFADTFHEVRRELNFPRYLHLTVADGGVKRIFKHIGRIQNVAWFPETWVVNAMMPAIHKYFFTIGYFLLQADLINTIFYSFTPSRSIIWLWSVKNDGLLVWFDSLGWPVTTSNISKMENIATGLFVVLLIVYVFHAIRYGRILYLIRHSTVSSTPGK